MGSSGRLITSADILDGAIATADIASHAVSVLRLDYQAASNLLNATSLPTATEVPVLGDQTFTVGSSSSLVELSVAASVIVTTATVATNYALYAVLDGSVTIPILAQQHQVASVFLCMCGSASKQLALSAGSHTVRIAIVASGSTATAYLRPSTTEFLRVQVTEYLR